MKLTHFLSNQGYDLIEGPVRNHKPLQLWLKQPFSEVELYYDHISHAFKSEEVLTEIENQALNINSTYKNDYEFNIGMTLLEDAMRSLGLATFELSSKIASGKTVTISYDHSMTKEYAVGHIEEFLATADFIHANPPLLKNANQNHILIITGVVFAQNLVADIETDFSLNAELIANLNTISDNKISFTSNMNNQLQMVSGGDSYFPIAVKASRIDFDRATFKKLNLITDSRNIF